MLRLCLKSTIGIVTVLAAFSASGGALAQQATLERVKRIGTIKVCVDQDNLPYSSDKPETPGFDVEIAREIAKELGLNLGYHWYATNVGKRALRQLHGENNCDFFPGVPHEENFEESNFKLLLTKPYYNGGFATMVPVDAPESALADNKTKGVGVQLGTLADFKLFDKGFERKLYKSTEEIGEALAHKEIGVGVTPAPEGAWFAISKPEMKLKVLAKTEKEFLFPMSIAVRKPDKDLKAAMDAALDKIASDGRGAAIFKKYGMVRLVAEGAEAPKSEEAKKDAEPSKVPDAPKSDEKKPDEKKPDDKKTEAPADKKADAAPGAAKEAASAAAPSADPGADDHGLALSPEYRVDTRQAEDFPNDEKSIDDGRKMYKQACYKCHGPNGVSGGTIPDLRIYAAKADHYEMFGVIQAGRLERGMPAWNDYLNETEMKAIIVYVKALHKK